MKGFSLLELVIVIAIVVIFGASAVYVAISLDRANMKYLALTERYQKLETDLAEAARRADVEYRELEKRYRALKSDLDDQTNKDIIREASHTVQSAVNISYAEAAIAGAAAFPAEITADMFADGKIPPSSSGVYYWEYDSNTGLVSTNIE